MKAFANLIDALVYTTSRNRKLALIAEYLREAPDPDRGWVMGALTGELDFPAVKSSTIRNLMKDRVDPVLWTLSRDFVGDTAETASLLWPSTDLENNDLLTVSQTVERLLSFNRVNAPKELPKLLDKLDSNGRFALIKLATGGMRIGVSARLAKTAFAKAFDVSVDEVEEYWHALEAPYAELFQWAADKGPAPDIAGRPRFRPFMLAHPLEENTLDLK
ncbi:MAG: ATP-dependent DNA ligase, partial [Pseudomonadota bacterium]